MRTALVPFVDLFTFPDRPETFRRRSQGGAYYNTEP